MVLVFFHSTLISFNSFLPQIPQEETESNVLLLRYPFPNKSSEIVTFIIVGMSLSSFSILKIKVSSFCKYLQQKVTLLLILCHYWSSHNNCIRFVVNVYLQCSLYNQNVLNSILGIFINF